MTFRSCNLNNNRVTSGTGGAAYVLGSTTTFIDTNFYGNTATVDGGALYANGSTTTITLQQVRAEHFLKVGPFVPRVSNAC